MSYSELIKNFNRIRDYMRDFYIYGFKSRDQYTRKSLRSYDNERRRIESWLGDYMKFRQNPDGKNVFISIDSRLSRHNPLYKAWKTKSFTDGDITLHFILMDILSDSGKAIPLTEIMQQIDRYLSGFESPRIFDESTVRKKLKEYMSEGIVAGEKRGRAMYYRRMETTGGLCDPDILDFFSEIAPCGVIGLFLLDKTGPHNDHFAFKHHYITGALDSEILCNILMAMREKRSITIVTVNRRKDRIAENNAIPLRIMFGVQSGRQYLMAYAPRFDRITSFRIDNIVSVKVGDVSIRFDEMRAKLEGMMPHMWGISTQSRYGNRMEHVEFTIRYDDDEPHILKRLEREKRCGRVERLDKNSSKFTADVYDASEMVPWIRTFICRITDIRFSNKELEAQFKNDIKKMYVLYGLEGGESNDIQ